jgi:hypothetical protein
MAAIQQSKGSRTQPCSMRTFEEKAAKSLLFDPETTPAAAQQSKSSRTHPCSKDSFEEKAKSL